MPVIKLADLTAPVSEAEPCGPDLDARGDSTYLTFLASAEGFLPASYFDFDRSSVDFDAVIGDALALLGATRDLRLLILLAKFSVLGRDLDGFAVCMEAIATLLQDRWDDLHPRPDDGDASARMALLNSLDDLPSVVLPLQYVPLLETERDGAVSFRATLIAAGEAQARKGEAALDAAAVEKVLTHVDLAQLIGRRDCVLALRSSLRRFREICDEHGGSGYPLDLEKLPALVPKMLAMLDGAVAKRDPGASVLTRTVSPAGSDAPVGDGQPQRPEPAEAAEAHPPGMALRIGSGEDAAEALAAVAAYFSKYEPSSPALLLVRQAQQLIGKSFLEVMQILVPAQVENAKVQMGNEQPFSVPLQRMSAAASTGGPETDGPAPSSELAPPPSNGGVREGPPIEARTRQDATSLLDELGRYYRTREPSSPIPLLTDRARNLVERDFLYLLRHLLGAGDGASSAKS